MRIESFSNASKEVDFSLAERPLSGSFSSSLVTMREGGISRHIASLTSRLTLFFQALVDWVDWVGKVAAHFFSSCFPCGSVARTEEFQRSDDPKSPGTSLWTFVVGGSATENRVKIRREEGAVHLVEVRIVDEKCRKLLPVLFEKLLCEEKVERFTTTSLVCAKTLVDANFYPNGSFIYNPKGMDETSRFVRSVIKQANVQKGDLSAGNQEILAKLQKDENLLGSFIHLGRSMIGAEGIDVPVTDFVLLTDAIGFPIR